MSKCGDIDALMIDWLYDELEESKSASFDEHLAHCARCRMELESLQHTRDAMRELPEVEPPQALSAILLHEAAKRAPAPSRARAIAVVTDQGGSGVFSWLASLFTPIVRHPGVAAVATLVLVAGVAGSLYLRGDHKVVEPTAESPTRRPPSASTSVVAEKPSSETKAAGATVKLEKEKDALKQGTRLDNLDPNDGYLVRLADEGDLDVVRMSEANQEKDAPATASNEWVDYTERQREVRGKKKPVARRVQKVPQWDGPLANVVSGADELVDREEAEESGRPTRSPRAPPADRTIDGDSSGEALSGVNAVADDDYSVARGGEQSGNTDKPVYRAKKKQATKADKGKDTKQRVGRDERRDYGQQPAPRPESKQGSYRVYRDPKKELKWAQMEERKLTKALRSQRCRDAARIANDILDRNPNYYHKTVDRSKSMKRCQWYVRDERRRRARYRNKARPRKASPTASPMEADMAAE